MKANFVELHNFGPFIRARLDLRDRGLVLIQANNKLSTSADSNGTGKSYLPEGVAWTWFGETIRGKDHKGQFGADDIVNNKVKKNCLGHLNMDADGQTIDILRYRSVKAKHGFKTPDDSDLPLGSGLMLFVDGIDKTKGTVGETQALINELLGMDFNTFVRSIYFDGNQVSSFPTLTDKEIKDVFEKVLGLEDLKKVSEVIKSRKSTAQSEASGKQSSLALVQSNISTFNVEIMELKSARETFTRDQAASAANLRARAAALVLPDMATFDSALEAVAFDEAAINNELSQFEGLDGLISAHNAEIGKNGAEINALEIEIRRIVPAVRRPGTLHSTLIANHAELVQNISHAYEAWKSASKIASDASVKIGKPCGECGKLYGHEDLGAIIEKSTSDSNTNKTRHDILRQHLISLIEDSDGLFAAEDAAARQVLADKDSLLADLHAKSIALNLKTTKYASLSSLRKATSDKLLALPVRRAAIETQRSEAALIEANRSSLLGQAVDAENRLNPHIEAIARYEKRVLDATVEYDALMADFEKVKEKLSMLEFLSQAYGQSGLKAHILQVVTPALNDRANAYAQILTDGTVNIEFTTTKVNKDGTVTEKFGVNVTNTEGAETYLGNSSGERKKIDLAIAFALSDLVLSRSSKSLDLWFADEIAESLDPTALDRVVQLLNDMALKRGTLMVISHTDMSAHIPKTIIVEKTAAGSVVL